MPPPPEPTPTLPIDPFNNPEDEIPLQQKRPFGSGLYRNPVTFVPASSSLKTVSTDEPARDTSKSISDLYLGLVLPPEPKPPMGHENSPDNNHSDPPSTKPSPTPPLCPSCNLPILPNHELSLPHQLSLPHSHPPSSLDRSRMGLQYLSSQGWDPDSRRGLGSDQQGIAHPLKPKPKDDRFGLGVELPKGTKNIPRPKEKLLDAKKARKQYEQEKKKKGRIMKELFAEDKWEKYLGKEAS